MLKDNVVNIKNRTDDFTKPNEETNPTDNATQSIVDTEKYATTKVGEKIHEEGKKSVIKTKENFENARNNINEIRVRQKETKQLKDKIKKDSTNNSKSIDIKKKKIKGIKKKNSKAIKSADRTSKLTKKQIKNTKNIAKKTEKKSKGSS